MQSSSTPTDRRKVSLAQIECSPWKNQRGWTQELLVWPRIDDWLLRVSVATIDRSGEFSRFDGITRQFMVLDGDGIDLSIDGVHTSLSLISDPLCFDGGAPCVATLKGGTVHALNVMYTPDFVARVVRVRYGESVEFGPAECLAIYGIKPTICEVNQDIVSLEPGDLVWMQNASEPWTVIAVCKGHCAVVMGNAIK